MPRPAQMLLALLAVSLCAGALEAEPVRYIRHIEIVRGNVYPDDEGFLHKNANRFHVVTRERVIRRELLVSEGDTVDVDLVEESERDLRGLDFFSRVEISVHPVGADSADIRVETDDHWSTIPMLILESGGGLTYVGGALDELNFLGLGKGLYLEGFHETDVGMTWGAVYDDPQILGSRWTGSINGTYGPLIEGGGIFVKRPHYSMDTKWAWGGGGYYYDQTRRVFQFGEEVSRFQLLSREISGFASRSWGPRFRKLRFTLDYRYEERDFNPIAGATTLPLANDELVNGFTGALRYERIRHIKAKRIDKFVAVEDFTMGSRSSLSLGRTGFPIPKGLYRWEVDAEYKHSFEFSPNNLLFTSIGWQTLETRDTIGSLFLKYYSSLRWLTFAGHISTKYSNDLEQGKQFILGANSGLRGYPAREFTGLKKIQLNLETRLFPPWKVLEAHVGGVAFFDGGNVWKREQDIDLSQMNYSAGVGLRLGFAKVAGAMVARLDVGWPVNRGGGAVVSLGAGQYF